jgi:hypothetical protein
MCLPPALVERFSAQDGERWAPFVSRQLRKATQESCVSTATRIKWTEVTWNPTTGCDRISPGCDHCYALTLAKRLKAMGQVKYQHDGDPRTSGPGFGVTMHADVLEEPLRWRTPRKVFVNSMSDVSGWVTTFTSSFSQFRTYARPSLRLRHMSRTGAGISLQRFGVRRRGSLASQRRAPACSRLERLCLVM